MTDTEKKIIKIRKDMENDQSDIKEFDKLTNEYLNKLMKFIDEPIIEGKGGLKTEIKKWEVRFAEWDRESLTEELKIYKQMIERDNKNEK